MISQNERDFFERIALPQMLGTYNNGKFRTVLVSDGMCKMIGMSREDIIQAIDNEPYKIIHSDDTERLSEALHTLFEHHTYMDIMFRFGKELKTGYKLIHGSGIWQPMSDGSEMILLSFDSVKRIQNGFRQLYFSINGTKEEMIYKDIVTGLPNLSFIRQFADNQIKELRICEKNLVLIYIDIKSMRSYNNHYGYEKGDDLMRLVAKSIKEVFETAFFGRAAEDHFVIIEEFTDKESVQKKINIINQKVKADAYGCTDGIRAGAYVIRDNIKAVKAIDYVRQAVKDIGSDMNVICSFYSEERNDKLAKERYIIENFETAMKNNWIISFYQPILRTHTKKITILESLARWIDPEKGMISPGEFIPVISRYHLTYKLDLYMAEQVCKDFTVRAEAGLPLVPVSVNFSAQDFDYVDIPARLKEITDKYNISADDIIVEITEQDIAKGADSFKQQLCRLRKNGHRLWIDDFGSGYSSLNVLGQYDIDRVKFDMDLLRHLDDNNGANRRIMKAMVNMCRELEIHTLAEGVETEQQLEFLNEINCELSQGFYLFKPDSLESSIKNLKQLGPVIPHETREELKASFNIYSDCSQD